MAIYHLSAKIISRKAGRSSTAAAAYRACEQILDRRTGEVHDFTRKRGLQSADLVMPSGSTWQPARAELWNAVEAKNKRADAQVAREFLVALPDELDAGQRRRLAVDFAQELADRYGIAADVAIHAPDQAGDNRNHHAHILTTTNRIEGEGLGNKVRELDLVAHNMGGGVGKANEIDRIRTRWAELTNERLRELGHDARIDHRTLEAQGIERIPTQHLGPTVTAIERRTGQPSHKRRDFEQQAAERLAAAKMAGELERQNQTANRSILDLSGDLAAAITQRDAQEQQKRQAFQAQLDSGRADFRAKYEAHKAEKEQQRLAELGRAEVERQRQSELEKRRQQLEREQEAQREQSRDRGGPGFSR
ncbi:MobQ family relaxase (plasmid) [Massilia cellulosiltytica]|uniref:MobQ family relaxase n=1 Tax=Massilia cellulosiltytica TaxID=2683234 RepID=UPI0039B43194